MPSNCYRVRRRELRRAATTLRRTTRLCAGAPPMTCPTRSWLPTWRANAPARLLLHHAQPDPRYAQRHGGGRQPVAGHQPAGHPRQPVNTKGAPRPSSSPGTRAKVAAVTTAPPIPQTWVATSRPWSSVPAPRQALGLGSCSTITHCSPRPNNCSACPELGRAASDHLNGQRVQPLTKQELDDLGTAQWFCVQGVVTVVSGGLCTAPGRSHPSNGPSRRCGRWSLPSGSQERHRSPVRSGASTPNWPTGQPVTTSSTGHGASSTSPATRTSRTLSGPVRLLSPSARRTERPQWGYRPQKRQTSQLRNWRPSV